MTLAELESLALAHNPALKQAEAMIAAAQGRKLQAGLWPNPVIGYAGEDLSVRNFSGGNEHSIFYEQRIPLGGKLAKSRAIFSQEVVAAEAMAAAEQQRVINMVRILYLETLGAQQLLALRAQLYEITKEAVEVSAELYNIGQSDGPDLLTIEIEAQKKELDLLQAGNDWEQCWRQLAALVGKPELKPVRLSGQLEESFTAIEEASLIAEILRESPEIKAARAGVEKARAALARARAERSPDLFLRGGISYSRERFDDRGRERKVGPQAFIEAGLSIPIFNRNQGAIATAAAELTIAERQVERLQLALRARLAQTLRSYRNSLVTVEKYRKEMIPRARRSYELYQTSFQQMAASYPQVLIARRNLVQMQIEYAQALVGLRRDLTHLRGYLLTDTADGISNNYFGAQAQVADAEHGSPNQ